MRAGWCVYEKTSRTDMYRFSGRPYFVSACMRPARFLVADANNHSRQVFRLISRKFAFPIISVASMKVRLRKLRETHGGGSAPDSHGIPYSAQISGHPEWAPCMRCLGGCQGWGLDRIAQLHVDILVFILSDTQRRERVTI